MLFVQKDKSGIRGMYQSMIFVPNETIIDKLQESTKDRAVNDAIEMFNE